MSMFRISLASQLENTILLKRNGPILSANILLLFHSSSIICKIKSQPLSRVPRPVVFSSVTFSSFMSLHSSQFPDQLPQPTAFTRYAQISAWNTFPSLSAWRRFISVSVLESSLTSPCPHRPSRQNQASVTPQTTVRKP